MIGSLAYGVGNAGNVMVICGKLGVGKGVRLGLGVLDGRLGGITGWVMVGVPEKKKNDVGVKVAGAGVGNVVVVDVDVASGFLVGVLVGLG